MNWMRIAELVVSLLIVAAVIGVCVLIWQKWDDWYWERLAKRIRTENETAAADILKGPPVPPPGRNVT